MDPLVQEQWDILLPQPKKMNDLEKDRRGVHG
jgi:hypothetical protein